MLKNGDLHARNTMNMTGISKVDEDIKSGLLAQKKT